MGLPQAPLAENWPCIQEQGASGLWFLEKSKMSERSSFCQLLMFCDPARAVGPGSDLRRSLSPPPAPRRAAHFVVCALL